MIRYVVGDATRPSGGVPRIIAHVCNDAGAWGAGFVMAVSRRWPQPEQSYRALYDRRAPNSRLCSVQFVPVEQDLLVANMIAQAGFGRDRPPLRYVALGRCLEQLGAFAHEIGASVHMPRIGCGLAGGKWDLVEALVNETLSGIDVTVYDLAEVGT